MTGKSRREGRTLPKGRDLPSLAFAGCVVEFVYGPSADGRGKQENWRKAVNVPTERQPNRGLTDDDPEFTCSVCRETFPMALAHRAKVKGGGSRRTGRCVPCALGKQREANDRQAAKRRGPDYVLPVIKDQAFPVVDGKRQCAFCGEVKPVDEFFVDDSVASGFYVICKPCHQDRRRVSYLLRMYNMTLDRYLEMLAEQDGFCAICKQPETAKRKTEGPVLLSVDHDHACCPGNKSCGKCVRQLLCHMCNHVIGVIEKRRVTGADLDAYITRHATNRATTVVD